MNEVFRPYLWKFVLIFLQIFGLPLVVWGAPITLGHNAGDFARTSARCQWEKLFVRMKRSWVSRPYVFWEGVATDRSKIEGMVNWSSPWNLRKFQGLLGLTSYYKWFVPCYAKLAWPLTELLKKDWFMWDDKMEVAFLVLSQLWSVLQCLHCLIFWSSFLWSKPMHSIRF